MSPGEWVTGVRFSEISGATVVGSAETDARNKREPSEISFGKEKLVKGIEAKNAVIGIQGASCKSIDRLPVGAAKARCSHDALVVAS